MGEDKIRYLVSSAAGGAGARLEGMRRHGFKLVSFGKELTAADMARAICAQS